jgi:hypothetical protein
MTVVKGALRGHFQSNGTPKNGYSTREAALEAKTVMVNDPSMRSSKRRALNVYKCEVCSAWHVGHRKVHAS